MTCSFLVLTIIRRKMKPDETLLPAGNAHAEGSHGLMANTSSTKPQTPKANCTHCTHRKHSATPRVSGRISICGRRARAEEGRNKLARKDPP